jgi:hypothetical protein
MGERRPWGKTVKETMSPGRWSGCQTERNAWDPPAVVPKLLWSSCGLAVVEWPAPATCWSQNLRVTDRRAVSYCRLAVAGNVSSYPLFPPGQNVGGCWAKPQRGASGGQDGLTTADARRSRGKVPCVNSIVIIATHYNLHHENRNGSTKLDINYQSEPSMSLTV